MPYTIHYDEQNKIIIGSFTGEVDLNLLRQFTLEGDKLSKLHHCHKILTDYSQGTCAFSVVEVFRLPQKHNDFLKSLGSNIHQIKRASVYGPSTIDLANFFENVAVNRGQKLKVFTDKEKALKWLLS